MLLLCFPSVFLPCFAVWCRRTFCAFLCSNMVGYCDSGIIIIIPKHLDALSTSLEKMCPQYVNPLNACFYFISNNVAFRTSALLKRRLNISGNWCYLRLNVRSVRTGSSTFHIMRNSQSRSFTLHTILTLLRLIFSRPGVVRSIYAPYLPCDTGTQNWNAWSVENWPWTLLKS